MFMVQVWEPRFNPRTERRAWGWSNIGEPVADERVAQLMISVALRTGVWPKARFVEVKTKGAKP